MAQGRASYARLFARHGRPATIGRIDPANPTDAIVMQPIKVLRRYAEEEPMDHEISQQETRFTLEWNQLTRLVNYDLPPRKGDRILKEGENFTLRLVRPLETHGEIVGYEVRCIGG